MASFKQHLPKRIAAAILIIAVSGFAGVEFPGPWPGKAKSSHAGDVFTLENAVISESWQAADGNLRPIRLVNKLTGKHFDQSGAELFRLALTPPRKQKGVEVAVRLETKRVVALASRDGAAWTELAAFPRAEFAGQPRLVRLGKMDVQAQRNSYTGASGAPGTCVISDFNLAKAT